MRCELRANTSTQNKHTDKDRHQDEWNEHDKPRYLLVSCFAKGIQYEGPERNVYRLSGKDGCRIGHFTLEIAYAVGIGVSCVLKHHGNHTDGG
tara:strand:- start:1445 stop:1723 length:279 start_codon:yes stop_codon:yes gene_type:complete